MKRILALTMAVALAVGLVGCSTVKGLGDDISTLGHWLTKSSEKAQEPGPKK